VSNDLEDLTRVEPRRDRYGRPLILPKGGGERVAMTRMSSLGAVMSNTFNLEKWKLRQVALGPVGVHRAAVVAASALTGRCRPLWRQQSSKFRKFTCQKPSAWPIWLTR
jgi:hypothetical protein